MVNAAIYARISKDDDDRPGLGVARQIDDCQREAVRRGWDVVEVYSDNDVSASGRKPRPAFDRMLNDVKAGRVNAVVCWDTDRLTRSPRENETIIDLADATGLQLANVGGEIDLSSEQGQMTFRIKGAVARHEIQNSAKRLRRKLDEIAAAGKPTGKVAFGYRRVIDVDEQGRRRGSHDEIDPAAAHTLRTAAQHLLAGESLRSVTAGMNAEGLHGPNGRAWVSTTLRQTLLRDRNAGLRTHRGQVVGRAAWEPLWDDDTHARVVALLTDTTRVTNRGAARKHLLSGLALCGLCGGPMRVTPGTTTRSGHRLLAKYQCKSCTRVARDKELVEEVVEGAVVERLSRPDALEALAAGSPERARGLADMIAGAEARLELIAVDYAEGTATGPQLRRVTAILTSKIDQWRRELATCAPHAGLLALTGEDAARRWDAAPLDVKRAVVDLLMRIVILPAGKGIRFDPRHVLIEWKA